MVLRKIEYQGFRNLVDAKLKFTENVNFLIGENGTGKTNLLEAIFFAGFASSFRERDDRNLICFNDTFLRVEAQANGTHAVVYLDNTKKKLVLQDNEIFRLSDFIGWLGITILSIEDIWIIRGSPARRRSFLDWIITKVSPPYYADLSEYRKVLRQRNCILQQINENGKIELLEIYDEQLIKYGNAIYKRREDNLPQLKKYFADIGNNFGLKKFDFEYHSVCPDMRLDHTILNKVRAKEIVLGQTIVGPHRDDLLFLLNGRSMHHYASEGEERAASISLKLAEAEILYRARGERPILLLDEVGPELDTNKRETLLNLLKGQIFYASTQMPLLDKLKRNEGCSIFKIDRGMVEVS